jgi:hypothetical protein
MKLPFVAGLRRIRTLPLALSLSLSAAAHAAPDLAGVSSNIKTQMTAFVGAAEVLLFVIGFIAAGVGIWKMLTAQKRQEPASEGLKWVLGGACMLALPVVIEMFTGSLFGSGTSTGMSKLNL